MDYNDYAVNYNYNQILNDELNLIIENDLKFKNHISYYYSFLKIIKKLDSNEKNELNILLDYLNNNKNNEQIKTCLQTVYKGASDCVFVLCKQTNKQTKRQKKVYLFSWRAEYEFIRNDHEFNINKQE